MSVLSDKKIRAGVASGLIGIDPFNSAQVQPASYDLCLGNHFRSFQPHLLGEIDPKSMQDRTLLKHVPDAMSVSLNGFCLASTKERIRMPDHLVGRVEGKSSLARLGLFVHVTAGFIDPGFEGWITLELFCAHSFGIVLYPGMPVCQISFERVEGDVEHPYGRGATGSKYAQQSREPQPSLYWKNFQ